MKTSLKKKPLRPRPSINNWVSIPHVPYITKTTSEPTGRLGDALESVQLPTF